MARPARFDDEKIIAATRQVIVRNGPAGATIARIADSLDAPTGSIYHRFAGRSDLLGAVWLDAVASFQDGFARALQTGSALEGAQSAVTFVTRWVRANPDLAHILLLYRSDDFLATHWAPQMSSRAAQLQQELGRLFVDTARRLTGRADVRTRRVLTYALAQAPMAAIKPHLEAGEAPPKLVDELLSRTLDASLDMLGVVRKERANE